MNRNSEIIEMPRTDWQQPDFVNDLLRWGERWPNFKPQELACKCCGNLKVHYRSLDSLQYLRSQLWKSPMRITSAYRCPEYNARIGGAANSYHKKGMAFDIYNQPWAAKHLVSFIWLAGQVPNMKFRGIGIYGSFVHLDTGPHRTWEAGDTKLDPDDRNDPNELE